ncbi:hypothetical protein GPALN_012528 [Globodera pallida]|nr:hypothetical protein GPALN_012528 [Globodera pallida]
MSAVEFVASTSMRGLLAKPSCWSEVNEGAAALLASDALSGGWQRCWKDENADNGMDRTEQQQQQLPWTSGPTEGLGVDMENGRNEKIMKVPPGEVRRKGGGDHPSAPEARSNWLMEWEMTQTGTSVFAPPTSMGIPSTPPPPPPPPHRRTHSHSNVRSDPTQPTPNPSESHQHRNGGSLPGSDEWGLRRPIESAEERPPLATEWPMNGPAHWDGTQPNPISVQGGQERYLKGAAGASQAVVTRWMTDYLLEGGGEQKGEDIGKGMQQQQHPF